jgi:hypothetical protein
VLVYQRISGIQKMSANDNWKIYPNPSADLLNIESDKDEILSINIYNIIGDVVFSFADSPFKKITLSMENISEGLYFIEIQTANKSGLKKFLKK